MIDWAALGIELLPCAANGQAALRTVTDRRPDLVITDIKMPVMDGLELIRRCRELADPRPEFLVLTSHEDFAFAREAVKHRVADYLIKLELTPDSLRRSVVEALGDRLSPPGPPRAPGRPAPQEEPAAEVTVVCRWGDTADEVKEPAARMLAEVLGREFPVVRRDGGPGELVLGYRAPGLDPATARVRFRTALDSALGLAGRYFNARITAEPAEDPAPEPLGRDEFRTGVEQALAAGDAGALAAWFDRARRSVKVHGRLADALDLGAAALYAVLAAAPQGQSLLDRIFAGRPDGAKGLYAVPSPDHVAEWLDTLEAGLADWLGSLGARHQEQLAGAMRRYVDAHFRERLQLKGLADQFRLSPNYAGLLFRRFAGRSFSEYVNQVKVDKARQMLASRKYRIYEISEYLGFENTYYFSKVFRRVTGVSPREYGSGEEKDQESGEKC